MILSTMNDEEKAWEAFRVYKMAKSVHDEYKQVIFDKFARGTKFPYFQRVAFNDDKNNRWCITYLCKNKEDRKKGRFFVLCHTTYEIQKKKSDGTNKYDGNTGKGIIAFDPIGLYNRAVTKEDRGMGMIIDIVPHAFNRYTERYLKPKGMENIEFQKKVESIILRWTHFDISGDESSEKHKDKGMIPYDVFMSGGGILRGQIVDEMIIRFFSYISKEMMYEEQEKWQRDMTKEYYHWKNEGKFDVYKH